MKRIAGNQFSRVDVRRPHRISRSMLFLVLLAACGCSAIGPGTIARDRFDYTTAVADSWKRQMLLNIVKIRYGDAPMFLEVASITNQYSVQTDVTGALGFTWFSGPGYNNQQGLSGATSYTYYDRPTISYNLLSGNKFAHSLMTPIAPATVMGMIEGGYPIDLVFRIMVHSVNGIHNQFGGSARMRRADPEFYPVLEKLREIQTSGAVALRVTKTGDQSALLMVFRKGDTPEISQLSTEVRRTLGLRQGEEGFQIVYGSAAANDREIALLTRSIIEIIGDISSTVEVPSEDVADKRTIPTMPTEGEGIAKPLVRILASTGKPDDAFVSVQYRDRWFWIDDRDYVSKKIFSFLMFVMTLTEPGDKGGVPVLTISAGG